MSGLWQTMAASNEVKRAGWVLLHSIWIGAAAAGVLAAAGALLRRRSSNTRYLAACAAMIVLVGASAATYFIAPPPKSATARTDAAAPGSQAATAAKAMPATAIDPAISKLNAWEQNQSNVPAISPTAPEPLWIRATRKIEPALPWIAAIWIAGVGALAIWQLAAWLGVRRIKTSALPLHDEVLHQTLSRLTRSMQVHRPIALLESAIIKVPTLIGWLSPAILLPTGLISGVAPSQLRVILAHELAHVRRHDYLINLLQTVIETLFFFHPAVWYISAQMRALREDCCDDIVIAGGEEPATYAQSLLQIARRALELRGTSDLSPALALGAVGKPSELRRRVHRLLGGNQRPARFANTWPVAMLLVAAMMAGVISHARSSIAAESKDPSPAILLAAPKAPQWGEAQDGLRARIIADKQTFRAGEAIPVRLEIENIGEKAKQYQTPAAPENSTLIVLDDRGQPVPYLGGFTQIMVRAEKLEPGKSKELKSFDLADWYYLRRPGRYTVRWPQEIILRGAPDDALPHPQATASAPFEFDITADPKLASADGDPVARLLPLIKKHWWLTANQSKPAKLNPGANRAEVMGRFISFAYNPTGSINDIGLIWLWLTDEEAAEKPVTAEWPPSSNDLGKIDRWHVYIHVSEKARLAWASAAEDLKKALSGAAIEDKPAPKPAASALQFRLVAQDDDKSEADEMPDPNGGKALRILKSVELDGRDIAKVYETKGTTGPSVGIDFSPEGAKKLEKLTTANINHRLAMILDGKLLTAPTIRSTIAKSLVITGSANDFTPEKVKAMIESINAGLKSAENPKPD